jgi:hypothetical protein
MTSDSADLGGFLVLKFTCFSYSFLCRVWPRVVSASVRWRDMFGSAAEWFRPLPTGMPARSGISDNRDVRNRRS